MKKTLLLPFLVFCNLAGANLFADVVTLKDGSKITGSASGTARVISIKTPDGVRSIPIDEVQAIRFGSAETAPAASTSLAAASAPAPVAAAVQAITLPAGTAIAIRTIDAIDSTSGDTNREYAASLDEAVVVNQVTVAPAKANTFLKIKEIKQAGRFKGSTTLSLSLIAIVVNGQRVALETGDVVSASNGKGKATIRDGAIGAAAGCGIGAAAAGVVGCEIGGAVGGVSGVATSVFIGKTVKIPPETRLTFKLTQPVNVAVAAPPLADKPTALQDGSTDSIIAGVRSAEYSSSAELPNLLVQQTTTRDLVLRNGSNARTVDVVVSDLSVAGSKVNYRDIKVNGVPAGRVPEGSGSWSRGEFDAAKDILSPLTSAAFTLHGQESIGNRTAWVFDFSVEQSRSHWDVKSGGASYKPAYRGTTGVDKDSRRALRVEFQATDLSRSFPLDKIEESFEYDFVNMDGRSYLVPVRSVSESCGAASSDCSRNVTEFRNCRMDSQPVSAEASGFAAALQSGDAGMKANDTSEALKQYQVAIDINARSSMAHYRVGEILFRQQNLPAAANEFRVALKGDLDPKWIEAWAHVNMGQIFDRVGQRERAVDQYTQAQRTHDNTDGAQDVVSRYLQMPYQGSNQ